MEFRSASPLVIPAEIGDWSRTDRCCRAICAHFIATLHDILLPLPSVDLIWMLWAVLSTEATAAADRAALERVAHGEAEALGEIYDRHGRLVYSLAVRILRDQ